MSDRLAIQLENVAVRYRVPRERISSFKEHVIRSLKRQTETIEFWALRDVNLQLRRGEVAGIIGKNGAGKSTLLKIIARVLHPTTGRVRVTGTVAPLLEFGAGFHPELTGRENIFLNAALLGLTRDQTREVFERIVDFAQLQDFIDTPLRTFSSGMIARLGFAVATIVPPDILLLDEIFSVGDAAFQKKSIARIQSFRSAGATILFVSHNPDLIKTMCDRVIWLEGGRVAADGSASAIVDAYQSSANSANEQRWGSQRIEITEVRIKNGDGAERAIFATGDALTLEMAYCAHDPIAAPTFGMAIHRPDGVQITGPNTHNAGLTLSMLAGSGVVSFSIPHLPMLDGQYLISVSVHSPDGATMYDYHDRRYPFRVENLQANRERYGLITVQGVWSHSEK